MSDTTTSLEDNREHCRMPTDCLGWLTTPTSNTECRVLNVSAGGAMVSTESPYVRDQRVSLEMAVLGDLRGTVVWREPGRIGILFDTIRHDVERFAGS